MEVTVNIGAVVGEYIDGNPMIAALMESFDLDESSLQGIIPEVSERHSIVSSVGSLFDAGAILAGLIVLVFSVALPITKQITLGYYLYVARSSDTRLSTLMSSLHKWAMVDVFVLAVTVVALAGSSYWSAQMHHGVIWFLLYVALSAILIARMRSVSAPQNPISKTQHSANAA